MKAIFAFHYLYLFSFRIYNLNLRNKKIFKFKRLKDWLLEIFLMFKRLSSFFYQEKMFKKYHLI